MAQLTRPVRHDPAPSLWAYRLERLMLTPAVRFFLRAGVPFLITLGATSAYLGDQDRRDQVLLTIHELRDKFEMRPEFMVKLMAVEGASANVESDIREVAQLDFPMTSFDIDLDTLQQTILELPAVKDVSLFIRAGNILQINVIERQPVVLWRSRDGLDLVDREGVVVGGVSTRATREDLPLIAGDGARDAVPEALRILSAAAPLKDRVRGLVRVGERRWDLVLDRGQRVLLPVAKPVQALERVIALDEAQQLFARDLSSVDMRLAARPTIRMNQDAVAHWWLSKDMLVEAGQ
ncbi:cell division protein FtsQ/DivIB [Pseudooceanicola nanhaiensis]|uniref:cell division protein FtsQ/DivIB n=1 Tax=Pseudooceanicola nanhaiensis TaxID=375761 RepID=UPI001CD33176|nr:cell division protein FtsQ/DivIB [Pseudooceanicola nanhaiensis]MCA0921122.1 cell division protein FtsQ/DivIB [Pseudooceanicola nanhaiensis]